jgi:energy-coupling factor transporter transmembrane protein EcfT
MESVNKMYQLLFNKQIQTLLTALIIMYIVFVPNNLPTSILKVSTNIVLIIALLIFVLSLFDSSKSLLLAIVLLILVQGLSMIEERNLLHVKDVVVSSLPKVSNFVEENSENKQETETVNGIMNDNIDLYSLNNFNLKLDGECTTYETTVNECPLNNNNDVLDGYSGNEFADI